MSGYWHRPPSARTTILSGLHQAYPPQMAGFCPDWDQASPPIDRGPGSLEAAACCLQSGACGYKVAN